MDRWKITYKKINLKPLLSPLISFLIPYRYCGKVINMICIRADIPNELSLIDDELKAIYHSTDTVCFYIFQTREKRNEFMERTQGMKKTEREEVYKEYS